MIAIWCGLPGRSVARSLADKKKDRNKPQLLFNILFAGFPLPEKAMAGYQVETGIFNKYFFEVELKLLNLLIC